MPGAMRCSNCKEHLGHQHPQTAEELASLAVNAARALSDERRHYELACRENADLRAELERMRGLLRTENARADAAIGREETAEQDAEGQRQRADKADAERERAQEDFDFLHRNTLPELRRPVEHHEAGRQQWRDRAETAERERDEALARLNALGEPAVEYGIRRPDGTEGRLHDCPADPAARERLFARYQTFWPGAVLVQRTVHRGPWTPAADHTTEEGPGRA
jgi:hypothetical protein